ncbi:MAG: hypothetical protein DRP29_01500 [Thermodesulfobacteriota bacterium]|nr:MAG: hypothetical protein DRP29_01500 [Thermodesulfobacteriota bacterium]
MVFTKFLNRLKLLISKRKVKKIVSHLPPRHLDDFLAIALLKNFYKNAEIEFIHPQEIPEEYYEDKNIILVDAGCRYEPEKKNFDHHQDKNIPCSLILVMKYFGLDINAESVKIIDYIDRFGFRATAERFGLSFNKRLNEMRMIILFSDLNKVSEIIASTFIKFYRKKSYYELIELLYKALETTEYFEEAKKRAEEEIIALKRKLSEVRLFEIEKFKVLFSEESLAPHWGKVFSKFLVDFIVEKNAMNPEQTAIIKNTVKKNSSLIDLSKIFQKYPKVFLHPTGFMAVVNCNIKNFNIKDLSICIVKNKFINEESKEIS